MSDSIKNGLLVAIAILTLVNTVVLLTNDNDVSYERTAINRGTENAAITATPPQTPQGLEQPTTPPPVNLGPKTTMQFAEMEHDFGVIDQNTTNPKKFTFTNTGDQPLIISDAKGSCGCTVPDYPRQPIAPGETGEIDVVYKPGNQANQQTKTVTITANTEPATTVLRIKANVTPGETPAAGSTSAVEIGG